MGWLEAINPGILLLVTFPSSWLLTSPTVLCKMSANEFCWISTVGQAKNCRNFSPLFWICSRNFGEQRENWSTSRKFAPSKNDTYFEAILPVLRSKLHVRIANRKFLILKRKFVKLNVFRMKGVFLPVRLPLCCFRWFEHAITCQPVALNTEQNFYAKYLCQRVLTNR